MIPLYVFYGILTKRISLSVTEHLLGDWVWLFLMGVGISLIYDDLRTIKIEQSLGGEFICCEWCKSFSPHEIWKAIARFLEKNEIPFEVDYRKGNKDFSTLIPFVQKFDIRQMKFFTAPPASPKQALFLREHNIRIAVTTPLLTNPNWIYVGEISQNGGGQCDRNLLIFLKREIKTIIEKMPEENSFCTRCEGKLKSVCYGPNEHYWDVSPPITKQLMKINPYGKRRSSKHIPQRKGKS